jgi:hypothetical protein
MVGDLRRLKPGMTVLAKASSNPTDWSTIVTCEMGASQQGPVPWNTEAEESVTLGTVTRQQLMKTQQTEKKYVL